MKKLLYIVFGLLVFFLWSPHKAQALGTTEELMQIQITPIPCSTGRGCPIDLEGVYAERGESCVGNIESFQANPIQYHYWIEDPDVTDQGRANERARQFIYWTIHKPAIDNSPTLRYIWTVTRDVAMFFIILATAVLGIGMIVGQRMNFDLKVRVWPALLKVLSMLVYVFFSAAIVLALIQLSEILMKFFIERLGGSDLFNIYFSNRNNLNAPAGAPGTASGWSEQNYLDFYGCRDLNIRVQEAAKAEIFLFKATNITYYVMGSMIILRKIILWFLLFVSPFLAILFPFTYIRNIAWIWVGVFFQWLFYGPLFALFLGALALIWKIGIPWAFDFSRTGESIGYIFPTAIIITYGGPGQLLSALNNGNYIDTFAEYVITLLMLWAVIVFPWWLLRIFRDYCCDYLMSIKNILLSWYDKSRPVPPSPGHPPTGPSKYFPTDITGTALKMPETSQAPVKIQLETLEQIRKTDTTSLMKAMDMSSTNITDIAKYETNKTMNQNVAKNIQYLQNPMKAESAAERQQYMNIRTELFNRAIKEDKMAKQVLSTISTSQVERDKQKETFVKSIPQAVQAAQPAQQSAVQSLTNTVMTDRSMQEKITNIASQTTGEKVTEKTFTDRNATEKMVSSIMQSASVNETVKENLVNMITESTTMDSSTKAEVLTNIQSHVAEQSVISTLAQAASTDQNVQNQLIEVANAAGVGTTNVTKQTFSDTKATNQAVTSVVQAATTNSTVKQALISAIQQSTQIDQTTKSNTVNALSQTQMTQQQQQSVVQTIAQAASTDTTIQQAIMQAAPQSVQGTITSQTFTDKAATEKVISSIVREASTDKSVQEKLVKIVEQSSTMSKESKQKTVTALTQPAAVGAQQIVTQEIVRNSIETASHNETVRSTIASNIAQTFATNTLQSQSVVQSVLDSATTNESVRNVVAQTIQQSTVLNETEKQNIVSKVSQNSYSSVEEKQQIAKKIAHAAQTDTVIQNSLAQTVSTIMSTDKKVQNTVVDTLSQSSNISQLVSMSAQVPPATVQSVTSAAVSILHKDNPVVTAIAQDTGVAPVIVTKALGIWSQNIDQSPQNVIQKITTETSLDTNKASEVIQSTRKHIAESKAVTTQVAQMANTQESTVQKVLSSQGGLVSVPKAKAAGVEHRITLPPEVSIEDYEEVKKMWTKQYESGEIPESDTVKTRKNWIDNDVVFITNVINKLLSTDEKVRLQGLDEIGYILPIFMINNFKGNELLVYLKAKLVAAKAIQEQLEKEEEAKKEKEEDLVEVEKPVQKEKEKEMQMEEAQAMELPEENKDAAPESSTSGTGGSPDQSSGGGGGNENTT